MTFLYILGVRSRPNLTAGARKTWGFRDLRPTLADRLRKYIPWGRQIPPYIWTDACYLPPWIFRNAKKPRPDLISPHHVAAQGSTTERVLVHFGHQHKRCIFDHITEHCTTPMILNTGRVQSKCIAQFDGKRGGMKTQAKRLTNLIDSNLQQGLMIGRNCLLCKKEGRSVYWIENEDILVWIAFLKWPGVAARTQQLFFRFELL